MRITLFLDSNSILQHLGFKPVIWYFPHVPLFGFWRVLLKHLIHRVLNIHTSIMQHWCSPFRVSFQKYVSVDLHNYMSISLPKLLHNLSAQKGEKYVIILFFQKLEQCNSEHRWPSWQLATSLWRKVPSL